MYKLDIKIVQIVGKNVTFCQPEKSISNEIKTAHVPLIIIQHALRTMFSITKGTPELYRL